MSKENKLKFNYMMIYLKMLGKIPSGKKSEEKNHYNESQKTNVGQRRMRKFNSGLVLGFTKLPNPEET